MEINLSKVNCIENTTHSLSKLDVDDNNDEGKLGLKESPDKDDFKEEATNSSEYQSGDDFIPPDEELAEKILKQVEYFFSDDNIWKDKFLWKHILRNRDGYVSLKLISYLRKVKSLSKDWRVVAHSLKNSKMLEMNEDMTKVRRVNPLSEIDNPANSGSIMVFEVPNNIQTSDDVKDLLKQFGTVTHASLLSTRSDSLSPHMKRRLSYYKHLSSPTFAVAKFSSVEDAENAIGHVSSSGQGFVVVPLINENYASQTLPISSPKEHRSVSAKLDPRRKNSPSLSLEEHRSGSANLEPRWKSPSPSPKEQRSGSSKVETQWKCSNSDDDGKWTDGSCDTPSPSEDSRNGNRRSRLVKSDLTAYPNARNNSIDHQTILSCRYKSDGPMSASWKQRRQLSGGSDNKRVIILRQPKGPDGTIGFHAGRSKFNLKLPKMSEFEL